MTYANNTAILITEVGEDSNAVLCRTDLTTCCNGTSAEIRKGNWKYPNDTLVTNKGDIYRDRRIMVVRLNRRENVITPAGKYCCEVPTIDNPSSNACITLLSKFTTVLLVYVVACIQCHNRDSITGPLMVTLSGSGGVQVAGEDCTLTCQFTGGETVTPVYQWLKDGSPLTGETSDTLSFSPLRETDSGGYTCEVTTGSLNGTSPSVTITVVGKCSNKKPIYNDIVSVSSIVS